MVILQVQERVFRLQQWKSGFDHRFDFMLLNEAQHVAEFLRVADLSAQDRGTAPLRPVRQGEPRRLREIPG